MTVHVADKIIIQDFDVATPVKKVGLAQSFLEKTRAKFWCRQLQVWNIRLEWHAVRQAKIQEDLRWGEGWRGERVVQTVILVPSAGLCLSCSKVWVSLVVWHVTYWYLQEKYIYSMWRNFSYDNAIVQNVTTCHLLLFLYSPCFTAVL